MEWIKIEDEPKLVGYEWADFGGHIIINGNDRTYTVKQLSPASLSCECKGFQYRGTCKHVDYLQKHVKLTKVPRDWAKAYAEQIQACFPSSGLFIAGSYLRGRALVKDLDFVLLIHKDISFEHASSLVLATLPTAFKPTIEPKSGRIVRGKLDEMKMDFYLCHPDEFGAMMMFLTGPKEFNIFCRTLARKMGYRLSQYGLFHLVEDIDKDGKVEGLGCDRMACSVSQDEIFKLLKLEYLSPEQREKFC